MTDEARLASKPRVGPGDKALGERIRAARIERGMTQEVLAAAVGISPQQLNKYERGENHLAAVRVPVICTALLVTPSRLLGMEPAPATSSRSRLLMQAMQLLNAMTQDGQRKVLALAQQLAPTAGATNQVGPGD